jgi:hypothetical protein
MGYFLIEFFQLQFRDYLFIYNLVDTFMKPISIVLLLFILFIACSIEQQKKLV